MAPRALLVLQLLRAAAAFPGAAGPAGGAPLDTLTFAQPRPSHRLQSVNATAEHQPDAPVDCRDALALDRQHGGRVLFDMSVSPTEPTHLTVKFWGGLSVVNGSNFTAQSNTWLLDATKGWAQHGWAHAWPCELDQSDPGRSAALDGSFPGRWQYATYPIPEEWTRGKTTLRLGLGTGLFQWYGGPGYMPSRPLFKAYTHVAPFLDIPADEMQGSAPPLAPPKPVDSNASNALAASVGDAVQHLFDVQVWNWTLVELGQMPACLFGAVSCCFP